MPPPGAPLPPRKRPGEGIEPPKKGRCLVRDDAKYDTPRAPEPATKNDGEKPRRNSAGRLPKSSDYQLLNGMRVSKKFFWVTAAAASTIIMAIVSVPMIVILLSSKPKQDVQTMEKAEAEESVAQTNASSQAIDAAPLRDTLKELRAAAVKRIDDPTSQMEQVLIDNAEHTGMAQARTLSFKGVSHSGNRDFDVNVFMKAPNQVRQVLEQDDTKITTVFDGQGGRLEIKDYATGRESGRELTSGQNLGLMMSAIPNWPLWQSATDRSQLEDGGQTTVKGQIYTVVINRSWPGVTVEHFYDENDIERLRRAEILDADSRSLIEVRFNEYKWHGAYYAPMEIIITEHGRIEVTSRIEISEWEFNKGLLPSLFVVDQR